MKLVRALKGQRQVPNDNGPSSFDKLIDKVAVLSSTVKSGKFGPMLQKKAMNAVTKTKKGKQNTLVDMFSDDEPEPEAPKANWFGGGTKNPIKDEVRSTLDSYWNLKRATAPMLQALGKKERAKPTFFSLAELRQVLTSKEFEVEMDEHGIELEDLANLASALDLQAVKIRFLNENSYTPVINRLVLVLKAGDQNTTLSKKMKCAIASLKDDGEDDDDFDDHEETIRSKGRVIPQADLPQADKVKDDATSKEVPPASKPPKKEPKIDPFADEDDQSDLKPTNGPPPRDPGSGSTNKAAQPDPFADSDDDAGERPKGKTAASAAPSAKPVRDDSAASGAGAKKKASTPKAAVKDADEAATAIQSAHRRKMAVNEKKEREARAKQTGGPRKEAGPPDPFADSDDEGVAAKPKSGLAAAKLASPNPTQPGDGTQASAAAPASKKKAAAATPDPFADSDDGMDQPPKAAKSAPKQAATLAKKRSSTGKPPDPWDSDGDGPPQKPPAKAAKAEKVPLFSDGARKRGLVDRRNSDVLSTASAPPKSKDKASKVGPTSASAPSPLKKESSGISNADAKPSVKAAPKTAAKGAGKGPVKDPFADSDSDDVKF